MPDAVIVATAAAVVTALNAAPASVFAHPFQAERSYADWELPLEESAPTDRVLVDVTPVPPLATELASRADIRYAPAVDVIVRRRLNPNQREADGKLALPEVDSLVLLVEQIHEFFTPARLVAYDAAAWESTELLRQYVPSHLREHHQFTGQIRLTFTVHKGIGE